MGLPLPFLLGLFVVFANRELWPPIPGSGSAAGLAPFLLLLAAPAALALAALRSIRSALVSGRLGLVPPRALLRLSAVATPLCLHLVLGPGGWSDLADRLSGDGELFDVLLLLAPLLVAEVPRLAIATTAELHVEFAGDRPDARSIAPAALPHWGDTLPIVRGRLGWPLLLVLPCAAFGVALDLLQLDRELFALFVATTPGATAGTVLFFVLASMLLPYWFRIAFGVRRDMPEPAGTVLRQTAAALHFPPRAVLHLPTGMRAMNAMMVGPLPIGRFLCVTDGLLRTLDLESLTGVVAHEVGHAKRGHPLILMTLAAAVPLLLPAPLRFLELDSRLDAGGQALAALAAVALLWIAIRTIAHRFEHEADAASVEALGSGPCTRALLTVSRAALPQSSWLRRHFTMHPEEPRRWEFMRRYENDAAFRARFAARGRLLRAGVLAIVAGVAIAATVVWVHEWPFERALWRFGAGDFRGAEAARVAAESGGVPARWQPTWDRLRENLEVASALAPDARDWSTARTALAAGAWPRGVEILLEVGPAAARPWLALAVEADPTAPVVQHTVVAYCAAIADEDPERAAEAARIVRRLGVPRGLEAVFAEAEQGPR